MTNSAPGMAQDDSLVGEIITHVCDAGEALPCAH